ncbi:MAG TPA: hypothetical protein VNA28_12515 [Solirubrobacteraceae bacterium]|nr:hypothetical protein [Solirubrobacteraceae bacterium]
MGRLRSHASNDDVGPISGGEPATGAPRWVKGFGIICLILVALVVVFLLVGSGDHGPGRHTSSGGPGDQGRTHVSHTLR